MELVQITPDGEGRQRAWTLDNPQPWANQADNTVQVDSRATKPVGGPVGVYAQPIQTEGGLLAPVHDGEEYEADCYVGVEQGAQWIQNDFRDGSYVWYSIIIGENGEQAMIPATNVGFTGLDNQGQHDGTLPVC